MNQDGYEHREVPEWARGDPLMEWYALEVWGKRVLNDDAMFEVMSLQIFQAGLSWRMILARRDAFRRAFKGWSIDAVADMGPETVDQMLRDASIIRNRKKIEACIANARIVQGIQREHGSLCHWFYNVLRGDDLPVLQQELRKSFKFVGPEIARMWLMASGRIQPHE
ncbi:MAG: DNA-3-methyladenine glycosylase I [Chloroflexi bacterium]|nr:DNA-3-methyladenine glycosylase I [Chloroflexota bacterium]